MHNPTEVLALIIAEKQEEITQLKAELAKAEATSDRYYRWWQEEEKKRQAVEAKLMGNAIKLCPDA